MRLGRKANWSAKEMPGCGFELNAGYRKWDTTVLSIILDKTGVIENGRKSDCWTGDDIFGIGRMLACFHWFGRNMSLRWIGWTCLRGVLRRRGSQTEVPRREKVKSGRRWLQFIPNFKHLPFCNVVCFDGVDSHFTIWRLIQSVRRALSGLVVYSAAVQRVRGTI